MKKLIPGGNTVSGNGPQSAQSVPMSHLTSTSLNCNLLDGFAKLLPSSHFPLRAKAHVSSHRGGGGQLDIVPPFHSREKKNSQKAN